MPRTISDLSRDELAALGREYLLAGHLIDRSGMPQVIAELGPDVMRDVAIEEWMGASPVYTRRVQKLLGFVGDDVATIFKGMQFDIGAPHQFMDFRYEVEDARHGEFRLAHCGALMDVEPMGEDYVVAMCHHIEDPTFDATACATNARARMRPIHRPPREPTDRHPHCHWTVTIEPDAEPVPEPAAAVRIAATRAASLPLPMIGDESDDDGWNDYAGELDPDLRLERFSSGALRALLDEVALQGHLLTLSFLSAIDDVAGAATTDRIGGKQFTGVAGVVAARLRDAFALGSSLDDLVTVLELHPAFHPRAYTGVSIERDASEVRLRVDDCDALHEDPGPSWISLITTGGSSAVEAIVQAVDPQAVVERFDDPGSVAAWRITHDPDAAPAPEPDEVLLTRFSTGADFTFT